MHFRPRGKPARGAPEAALSPSCSGARPARAQLRAEPEPVFPGSGDGGGGGGRAGVGAVREAGGARVPGAPAGLQPGLPGGRVASGAAGVEREDARDGQRQPGLRQAGGPALRRALRPGARGAVPQRGRRGRPGLQPLLRAAGRGRRRAQGLRGSGLRGPRGRLRLQRGAAGPLQVGQAAEGAGEGGPGPAPRASAGPGLQRRADHQAQHREREEERGLRREQDAGSSSRRGPRGPQPPPAPSGKQGQPPPRPFARGLPSRCLRLLATTAPEFLSRSRCQYLGRLCQSFWVSLGPDSARLGLGPVLRQAHPLKGPLSLVWTKGPPCPRLGQPPSGPLPAGPFWGCSGKKAGGLRLSPRRKGQQGASSPFAGLRAGLALCLLGRAPLLLRAQVPFGGPPPPPGKRRPLSLPASRSGFCILCRPD